MSGNLYQLWSKRQISPRGLFFINGYYDIYGYVIKLIRKGKGKSISDFKDEYLYLVRGTGSRPID